MRFAGIRKLSGSGSAWGRSFGLRPTSGSEKWKTSLFRVGGLKKGQVTYIKLSRNDRVKNVFKSK